MMNKYEKHKVICAELGLVYEHKNKTYGDAFGKTFKELGPISAVTRMTDKLNRIVSLVKGQENLVADESLIDTLRDLANYCIMTIIEFSEENETKELRKTLAECGLIKEKENDRVADCY